MSSKQEIAQHLTGMVGTPIRMTDLNNDFLPDVAELVATLNLPFGAEVVQRYGQAVATVHANQFWGLTGFTANNDEKKLAEAEACLRGLAADLAPTWQPQL